MRESSSSRGAPEGFAGGDEPGASPAAGDVAAGAFEGPWEPSRASRPRPREGRFVAIADYYAARVAVAQEPR